MLNGKKYKNSIRNVVVYFKKKILKFVCGSEYQKSYKRRNNAHDS